jgi:hypothetical protein
VDSVGQQFDCAIPFLKAVAEACSMNLLHTTVIPSIKFKISTYSADDSCSSKSRGYRGTSFLMQLFQSARSTS